DSPSEDSKGADQVTSGQGTLLLSGVLLMTAASLWLFSCSPPATGRVARIRGMEADRLPLRHPGYDWLNHHSPIYRWPALGKCELFYGLGAVVLSLGANLVRRAIYRGPSHSWKLLGWDLCLGLGLGASLSLALNQVVWPLGTDAAAIVA